MPRMKGKVGREESCIWLMTGRSAPWGEGGAPSACRDAWPGHKSGKSHGNGARDDVCHLRPPLHCALNLIYAMDSMINSTWATPLPHQRGQSVPRPQARIGRLHPMPGRCLAPPDTFHSQSAPSCCQLSF